MSISVVIAAARRTPIGKFGGGLKSLSAAQLAGEITKAVVEVSEVPQGAIDLVIFGHGRQAGGGPNTARQVVRLAGLPDSIPAYTVNQACASGLQSVISAAQAIRLGEADVVIAGGTESMSNTPFLLPSLRWGHRLGHAEVVDGMYRDGFLCPLSNMVMGETAEKLIKQEEISREDQDRYALESQRRWAEAEKNKRWNREIVPITIQSKKGSKMISKDEHPRPDSTPEGIAKLKPVFAQDGTVHPGNASGITDGASACLVMSEAKAKELGISWIARLTDYVSVGVDPTIMGIGPVPAVRKLLQKTGLQLDDVDLVELNEAFAGQVLACVRQLSLDLNKTNVSGGGAIALGHPIGCTGTRMLTTLLHDMELRDVTRGMATLCVSGGMGFALFVERNASK